MLVRAGGPSKGEGGLTRQPGYYNCYTVSVTVLYWELTRLERRGFPPPPPPQPGNSQSGVGVVGGVVCRREAVHASSADTFPVHSSRWEGRAEQAHV